MRTDTIATIGNTVVQHGPLNDRVYVLSLAPGDLPGLLDALEDLAEGKGYSKIFVKAPASALPLFLARGYAVEACVPRLFCGREDGYFVARYLDPARSRPDGDSCVVLSAALAEAGREPSCQLPPEFTCAAATPGDCGEIAALYREVFASYPFPILDPEYLRETMAGTFRYYIIRSGGKIVAVSSAEMYPEAENIEMTDFAVLPACRGHGLSGFLLRMMEAEMASAGMLTAYTICRASSVPINVTFARAGYAYGGTLVNNTNICGGFESMHVWYKHLSGDRNPGE